MATEKLGWDSKGKRWRKWSTAHGGWQYLSERGTLKTDKAAYAGAVQKWREILAGTPAGPAQTRVGEMFSYLAEHGEEAEAEQLRTAVDYLGGEEPKLAEYLNASQSDRLLWDDRLKRKTTRKGKTLRNGTDEFLTLLRSDLGKPGMSEGNFSNIEYRIEFMLKTLGAEFRLADFNEDAVRTLGLACKTKYQTNDCWKTCQRVILWLASEKMIPGIPSNLLNKDWLRTGKVLTDEAADEEEVNPMPLATWRTLYAAAPPRVKLYLLLAANCGWTQIDIGSVLVDHFDAEAGTLTCRRKKTKRAKKRPPLIVFKLWPETLELLAEFANDKPGERLILNDNGAPITQRTRTVEKGKKDRKLRTDNIASSMNRLWQKIHKTDDLEKHSFKGIRKQSASLLENHVGTSPADDYHRVYRFILGRAPQGVDERHYLTVAFPLFHKAQEFLREKYLGTAK